MLKKYTQDLTWHQLGYRAPPTTLFFRQPQQLHTVIKCDIVDRNDDNPGEHALARQVPIVKGVSQPCSCQDQ
eukprot:scaffold534275_cov28-Prasinocladus_malaysianus.AAC.1